MPIARRLCEIHLGEGLAIRNKVGRMAGVADRPPYRAGEARLDPRMRRQLEALGYLASRPTEGDEVDDAE